LKSSVANRHHDDHHHHLATSSSISIVFTQVHQLVEESGGELKDGKYITTDESNSTVRLALLASMAWQTLETLERTLVHGR
jgi:hypothetical protein